MHRVGIVIAALLVAVGALVLSLAPEVAAMPSSASSTRDVVEGTADLAAVLTGDALDAAVSNAGRATVVGPLAALAVLLLVALVVADRRIAALPPPAVLRLHGSVRGGSVGRRAPPTP